MMEKEDIVIGYETLFELLRLERSRTELQQLPPNYAEEIKRIQSEDLSSLLKGNDDAQIQKQKSLSATTKKIINEIYERREKKIVNLAVIKSKAKNAIIEYSRFLEYEKKMFLEIVALLDAYAAAHNQCITIEPEKLKNIAKKEPLPIAAKVSEPESKKTETQATPRVTELQAKGQETPKKMAVVRFLSPVPRFLGPEMEEYGPFEEEDVATVPKVVSQILVEKGRAQEIKADQTDA